MNVKSKSGLKDNEFIIVILISVLILLVCLSFMFGRYSIHMSDMVKFIKAVFLDGEAVPENIAAIITKIRFPRIAGAVFVGAALSVSGAAYQGVSRNPMVSPDILGASAGAGFGAALGILMSLPAYQIQIISFLFGIGAVSLSYVISRAVGHRENTTLVLSGMVISALFSAFVSIIKYVADPYSKLPEITFWLMGSLSTATNNDIKMIIIPLIIGITALMLVRWRLNVLAFGDEEAMALGINTSRLRVLVIVCATFVTSAVVSVSGQIGWVGLIIPHLGRMMTGPDYKYLLPVSVLTGSIYLLLVDNVARNLFIVEISLGILTAIIGAPFFIYLLLGGKKGWI